MNHTPEMNRVFRIKKDLSLLKIEKDKWGDINLVIYFRYEKYWINLPTTKMEDNAWKNIEKSNWNYLFEYEVVNFSANNLELAISNFLDESLKTYSIDYVKELGLSKMNIAVTGELEELLEDNYSRLKKKLANGSILQIEIWRNEDGSFRGFAQEVVK